MSTLDHPSVTKVAAALREAGLAAAADGIRILDDEARTAALAARALGVAVGAIANSLVFRTVFDSGCGHDDEAGRSGAGDDRVGRFLGQASGLPSITGCPQDDHPLLALTSGAHRADPARLAELVGARRVLKADPAFVREHTGQAIGGVAPVGHPRPVTTLVDRHLARYPVVWAAGGHPKSVFPTTFADLVALTGGMAAHVSAEEEDGPL